ncbi:HtaA domain-containing protein [Streptomyces sp. x-80]|uniref:HtaA domain-containing protein n=1 Tax=Streptomyces sp. x-80 TaxID=2789282 RepID=UPI00397F403F
MPAIRRSLTLAAALATTAALGLPAVAIAADGRTAAPRLDLKDGRLDWGVKESFRKYVTGIAHGTIETVGGAQQAAGNGPFTFSGGTGSYDTATHSVATTFQGGVRFSSTAHGFDIKIADLKLSTKGTGGAITADVTAAGKTEDDVPLASLDLSGVRPGSGAGGAMTFAGIPTKLTAEGAKAFNGMYKEGQELDPAILSVTPATTPAPKPDATQPPTTGPSAEPTTEPGDKSGDKPGEKGGGESAEKPGTGKPAGKPGTDKSAGRPGPDASSAVAVGTIVDGTLDWGVKKSFREYVTGPIGGGRAELGGGAATSGAGYRFPKGHGSVDAGKSALAADFNGSVRFLAHSGALDLKFGNLKVKVSGTKGTLVADVSAKSRASGKVTTTRAMPVADLAVPAGALTPVKNVVTLDKVPATLTAAGATAFDNMYPAGRALDPVTLAVSLDANAQLPAGGSGSGAGTSGGSGASGGSGTGAASFSGGNGAGGALAATGSAVPTEALIGTAAALVVAGSAAAYATRRRAIR